MTQEELEKRCYRFTVIHGDGVTVQTRLFNTEGFSVHAFVGMDTAPTRATAMQAAVERAMAHYVMRRLDGNH